MASTCKSPECSDPATKCGYCPEHKRHRNLAYRYGMSPDDYERLFAKQRGKCAGCNVTGEPLVVDHDHNTGHVRGLLCNPCNKALGFLRDNPITLTRLLRYLARSCSITLNRPLKR